MTTKENSTNKNDRIILKSYQQTVNIKDGILHGGTLLNTLTQNSGEVSNTPIEQTPQTPEQLLEAGRELSRDFYKKLIARPFENIIIFSGAGTSKSSGGKVMKELWDEAFPESNKTENETFFKSINFNIPTNDSQKNLEEMLSQAQKAIDVLDDDASNKVVEKINIIKNLIIKNCTIPLNSNSPHLTFLNKLTSRKLKYSRIKLFTLNYDTLFEQAATEGNFIIINGFSFSNPAYFNGSFFDHDIVNRKNSRVNEEENFVKKVFHLYKPHGSINWEKPTNGKILAKEIDKACADPLIVYPNSNKYEYAYDQPFFEMMSRFQQSVRQPNTLLICIGFGFGDKHFRNVIIEAAKSNPGLNILIALPNFNDNTQAKELIELTEKQNNIVFIDEYFEDLAENYPFSNEYEHDITEQ